MPIKLIDSEWDKVLMGAIASHQPELRIICPFIKHGASKRLFLSGSYSGIQVITRFNLLNFYDRVSDIAALRMLLENGAEIRGVKDLHAKLYLFGENQVIVTSANLTEAALTRNHEFGFISKDAGIITQCREYFDTLWNRAGSNLTVTQLDKWQKDITAIQISVRAPSAEAGLLDEGVDAGIKNIPITCSSHVTEVEQSFVKFLGQGYDRETLELPVIEELESSGCHWAVSYPKGKRPRITKDGDIIFIARMVVGNDIIIFGRAVAIAHVEGRDDATEEEIHQRAWKADWPHYVRVHHGEFVAGTLKNGISLSLLMDALGSDAFISTQANAEKRKGNTNPRRAYRQQPYVRLSQKGFEWVTSRLEKAFRDHGKLSPLELEELDWPKKH